MWDILINTASKVLGGKDKDGKSQLLELFKGDQQKQRDFELDLNIQYERRLELELQDRANARGMQIEALKQDDILAKRFIYFLTGGILAITGLLALYPLAFEIPIGNEAAISRATDFFYMIAGGSVIGFFYGTNTSKNSKNGR